jgi:hypothetical protein
MIKRLTRFVKIKDQGTSATVDLVIGTGSPYNFYRCMKRQKVWDRSHLGYNNC